MRPQALLIPFVGAICSLVMLGNVVFAAGNRDLAIWNFNGSANESPETLELKQYDPACHQIRLPKNLVEEILASDGNIYILKSPTQNTGGYNFKFSLQEDVASFCLRRPSPLDAVTQALSNPSAVAIVSKTYKVSNYVDYCK